MKILILEHEPEAPAALFGDWASARDHELQIVPVPQLERWPVAGEQDVIVSLGSDSSVHSSPDRWVRLEVDYLRAAHGEGISILGICFGAQALAKALGGEVGRAPHAEVAWREVAGDGQLITPGPWFRWHADRFTLPPRARRLSGSKAHVDAFAHGRSLGVQFHPEVDARLAERWIAGGRARLTEQGIDTTKLREEVARHAPGARRRAFDLFDRFAAWWLGAKPR